MDPFKSGSDAARDPWSGYSRDRFYTRAYDSQGHATSVRFEGRQLKVTRELLAQMAEMKEKLPIYRTYDDMIRNYVVHGLKYDLEHSVNGELSERAQHAIRVVFDIIKLDSLRTQTMLIETREELRRNIRIDDPELAEIDERIEQDRRR